jgi:hypothetical protein
MANDFRYLITNLWKHSSGYEDVIAELPFTGVNFTSQLNSIGTFQGHLLLSGVNSSNLNVLDATIPGKTALYVDYNGTIVWGGVIWQRNYDADTQTLDVTAQEFESYFQRRRIINDKTYTNADPLYVVQNLVSYAQGKSHGDIGVIVGSESSSLQVTKVYNAYEVKSVYQAIKDLAQGSLFDFLIVPAWGSGSTANKLIKTLKLGSPTLGYTYDPTNNNNSWVFSLPGNIVSYNYAEDGISAANQLFGIGYGANSTRLISQAYDPTYIGTYGDWPLLEDATNYIDVSDSTLLANLTVGKLNALSYPPTIVKIIIPSYVDPYLGSYSVGDEARISITDDLFPTGLDDIYRITAIDVSPGENGPDRVTVTLMLPLSTTGTV